MENDSFQIQDNLNTPVDSAESRPLFEDQRAKSAFIHESSYVDSPCLIGEHTAILHFTHIMAHAIIGSHCHIGHNVTIGSGVVIGNHVRILNNTLLNSGVILEDNVYCGASTIFTALNRIRGRSRTISPISPTLVKSGANIGANTTVAAGVTIGQHSFVEAGSVVDNNIPDFALVYGNPVRFEGWRCQCGECLTFHKDKAYCKHCGKRYTQYSEFKILQEKVEAVFEQYKDVSC